MRNKLQGANMKCYRCSGLMIYEKFYGDCGHFFGWKCISCGEIIDPVILENRFQRKALGTGAKAIYSRKKAIPREIFSTIEVISVWNLRGFEGNCVDIYAS